MCFSFSGKGPYRHFTRERVVFRLRKNIRKGKQILIQINYWDIDILDYPIKFSIIFMESSENIEYLGSKVYFAVVGKN